MATISVSTEEKVFRLQQFLGLNENPDGDTKLKFGEATACQNWTITRDRNLRRRNGTKAVSTLSGSIKGMWNGVINGKKEFLVATNDHLYRIWDDDNQQWISEELGFLSTDNRVTFFPFNGKVFMLNGKEYYEYDGRYFHTVRGYRPLIAITRSPSGASSTLLEEINKLNGCRRIWFSPDGTSTEFCLIDTDIQSVDYVLNTSTGAYYESSTYSFNLSTGKVTFTTAPTLGVNTIEIGYTVPLNYRRQVTKMTQFELFSGSTDARVFLYGDGSNECFYSSVDYDGVARADYFPDLNEISVGSANTPLTALIRHNSTLCAFKSDSAWSISYSTITLSDDSVEDAFYVKTINKILGNSAIGQCQLVLNNPRTIFGHDIYEWKSTSYYSSNLSTDERAAKRISDRIHYTLSTFDTENVYTFDDNEHQEYYIVNCATNEAIVNNYAADAWYYYDQYDMQCATVFNGDLYIGTSTGKVCIFSDDYYNDCGTAFTSYWESGSIDFGRPYEYKFSSMMWLVIKPESRGLVNVTLKTDKKSDFDTKSTESFLLDFGDVDFSNFTFDTDRSPKTHRHKLKAKRFVYYKIILSSDDGDSSATALDLSFRVRFSGYAK